MEASMTSLLIAQAIENETASLDPLIRDSEARSLYSMARSEWMISRIMANETCEAFLAEFNFDNYPNPRGYRARVINFWNLFHA
jgi:hypothetical protein